MLFMLLLVLSIMLHKTTKCNDCVTFDRCPEALDMALHKRDQKSAKLFQDAACGSGFIDTNGIKKEMLKVCCSYFARPEPIIEETAEDRRIASHPNLKLLPQTCGAIKGDRIVGGRIADLYEFPWMALISHRTRDGLAFRCGGSIIHKRYILTAAHCVRNKTIAGVRVGELDIGKEYDCNRAGVCENHIQDIPVEKSIVHEEYTSLPRITKDIALLRLAVDIDFNHKNVDSVCLPKTTALRHISLENRMVTVTGWGLTEFGTDFDVLRKVNISTYTTEDCSIYAYGYETTVICAGELNKDSCNGDSGGPLMLEQKYNDVSSFVQYGVVSNGPQKCGSHQPGIYTDVRTYMGWILDNMTS